MLVPKSEVRQNIGRWWDPILLDRILAALG